MELIYLRHGQTEWNVTGRLQGRSDVPLNDVGIEGAKRAGEILKQYSFDAIFCSPLTRTVQTLQYALPDAKPELDDRLLEWSFGPLEGKVFPWDSFRDRWYFGQPPIDGVEQIEDVVARISEFYQEKKALYPNGRILVVSHGGVSGALHGAVYGIKEGENLSPYCLPNTTPFLFEEGKEPKILEVSADA